MIELRFSLVTSERTAFALKAGATAPPTIDLLVNGSLQERRVLPHSDTIQEQRFTIPASPIPKTVELWLPHNVGCSLQVITSDAQLNPLSDNRPSWIFHGSSITHDALAAGPSETWPARLSDTLGWQLRQMGFRGECHLDFGVAKSIALTKADGIVLELGINVHNFQTYRQRSLRSALHSFIETIRLGHRATPIVVISPIFGGQRETESSTRLLDGTELVGDLNLSVIREEIERAVETRRSHGDSNIFYVDGLSLLGSEDATLFPDGLHPNHAGTQLIEERLLPILQKF